MNQPYSRIRQTRQGQTLIVALIILGVLLILGFVFIGIINRNIQTSARVQDRSVAIDLSEAGIRYAHAQMLRSELGADWRGTPTPPLAGPSNDETYDPDAHFLRPAARLSGGGRVAFTPGGTQLDLGGPDGLGPFIRVPFANGRALVRVRYSQSDANLFRAQPEGPLRQPGLARNYLIIESVGREGVINPNDPTTLPTTTPRRIQNYADAATFQAEVAQIRQDQSRFASIPVNRAFVSIGIIETARYVHNKFRVSRPAELGIPADLGAQHRGNPVAPQLRVQVGTQSPLLTFATPGAPSIPTGNFPGFGSMHVNGDLRIYGGVELNLNETLGDQLTVAGEITGDDGLGVTPTNPILSLNVTQRDITTGNWTNIRRNLNAPRFSSRGQNFQTFGVIRDGFTELDIANRPRGVGYKTPPSILQRDPQTGASRYLAMTRDSGVQLGDGNSGRFGHGRGVYVDNTRSRQTSADATSRTISGGETSLINEWLNPGGNPETTGWRGWLYSPKGAMVELLSDGFTIQRDDQPWRAPNGASAGSNFLRFRIGRDAAGRLRIVNTLTFADPNTIDGALTAAEYGAGSEFNGVVYFEGNVRVRGIIPTDAQISIVSNATIYIDGSITKGVVNNDLTGGPASQRITRPSGSLLMLMARDYVTVNTTQFFGPLRTESIEPKDDVPGIGQRNPIRMRANNPEGLGLQVDFVLDPNGPTANPAQPNTWQPYAASYAVPGAPSQPIATNILFSHTMDEIGGSAAFLTMNVNPTLPNSTYGFPGTDLTVTPPFTNVASEFVAGTTLSVYGLGSENFERYPQFETVAFPLINPNQLTLGGTLSMTSTAPFGSYTFGQQGVNELRLRPTSLGGLPTNDYLLGRAVIAPHDIRIEASVFAEEGSFFVIPGAWFNPNPNDTYDAHIAPDEVLTAPDLTSAADLRYLNDRRFRRFGVYPIAPFYGEPVDVRIEIRGSVSENVTAPMSSQAEWLRKWGWIPGQLGTSGVSIPEAHTRGGDLAGNGFVPNLTISYDPVLATGRLNGFVNTSDPNDPNSPVIRVDDYGRPLPPLPRLPVSPTLAFFGEVR